MLTIAGGIILALLAIVVFRAIWPALVLLVLAGILYFTLPAAVPALAGVAIVALFGRLAWNLRQNAKRGPFLYIGRGGLRVSRTRLSQSSPDQTS